MAWRARRGARRGFTFIEALICLSLVGTVSAAVFLLFYTGEMSFIGSNDEGIAVAEAQSMLRHLATRVRESSGFVAPSHGGLALDLGDDRKVEFYQDGPLLKRADRNVSGSDEEEDDGGSWLIRLLERLLGRGRGGGGGSGGGGTVSETTSTVASGLSASGGFTFQFYDESMNLLSAPRTSSDYERAAAVQVTVLVPWAHDGLGRVKRTTLLSPRNRD